MPVVKCQIDTGVGIVTINRPVAMNAMSREVRSQFAAVLARLDGNDAVGAIVITGEGDRAFSAGLDLRELGSDASALREVASDDPACNPVAAVERCGTPVLAAINGVCVTGALEVALACDIMICAERARFADTHARIGLLPVWGLSQRLSRAVGPSRAREMSLTGRFVSSHVAEAWGLVSRVVPDADLLQEAVALAKTIAANNRDATRANKALMKRGFEMALGPALYYEREKGATHNASITPEILEARRQALVSGG
jgi:enoyl-CoA hydratase